MTKMQTLYTISREDKDLPRANVFYADKSIAFAVLTYLHTRGLLDQSRISAEDVLNEFSIACRIAYQKYHASDTRYSLSTKNPLEFYNALLEIGEQQCECSNPSDVPIIDLDIGFSTSPLAVFEVKTQSFADHTTNVVESFDFTGSTPQKLKGFEIFYTTDLEVLSQRVSHSSQAVLDANLKTMGSRYYSPYRQI